MEELKKQYDEKSAQKEELRKKAEITELKLERAGKLVSGLAGERDRWEASVKVRKPEHWKGFVKFSLLGTAVNNATNQGLESEACSRFQAREIVHRPSHVWFWLCL